VTAPSESRDFAAGVVAAVPGLSGARVIRRLAAGPTNITWLVEDERSRWVLRLDRPAIAELGLSRGSEGAVCVQAAAAGITPVYHLFDASAGIYLRRFVPGRALSAEDLSDPRLLERLAAILRKLHGLPPAGEPFDPVAAVGRYAAQLGTRKAAALAERAVATLQTVPSGAGRLAMCHNDLVAENIIETSGGRLMLIDWEYAGVGDPFFDLAVVIRHHGLGEPLARGFLEAYLQRTATADQHERLTRLCAFYGCLLELWTMRVGGQ